MTIIFYLVDKNMVNLEIKKILKKLRIFLCEQINDN